MFISEIIIDGFKSYAQRTVVSDFDPFFNAITGLNGSGKSNILDAICFVLGISNLSQVRASTLQELIYKQGQAGVTKATVSIVFNNEDKDQSPIGYEQHDTITVTRQIAIGGKNKYMINGHNAQQSRVANLFQSVQLNVNNPHFLIMQGRITKVLNMKPPEILSMIEEAAGTRMFESKKTAALKTMTKKDKKVQEIQTLLDEDITPTLEKLRKERTSYLEFQKTKAEIDLLTRFLVAWSYQRAEQTLSASTDALTTAEERVKELRTQVRTLEGDRDNTQQNISLQQKRRDAEMNSALRTMEEQVGNLSKVVVKAKAEYDNKVHAIEEEEAARKAHLAQIEETQKSLEDKAGEIDAARAAVESGQTALQAAQDGVAESEKRCMAASVGASSDGTSLTFAEQIKELQSVISTASTQMKQAEMTISHATSELKTKKPNAKKSESEYKRLQRDVNALETDLKAIEEHVAKLAFDEGEEAKLHEQKQALDREYLAAKDQVDTLSARLSRLTFEYKDPEPGFDRSQVHGLVAELIDVADASTGTALEITAGGKLYNVVVKDEVVGKKLLSKGQLKRRVTIIPLNKIAARSLKDDVVRRAKQEVGEENVDVALSLIGYPAEVAAAMEYVFGRTLVCRTLDMAKKVTFHDKIRARTVTLDGDVFDPSGTLTGGAKASSSGVLLALQSLSKARRHLTRVETELSRVNKALAAASDAAARYQRLISNRDMKASELEVLRVKLDSNVHYKAVSEVKELEETIASSKEQLTASKKQKQDAEKKIKQLEKEQASYADKRDEQMRKAEEMRAAAKEALKAAKAEVQRLQQAHEEQVLERDALAGELKTMQRQTDKFAETLEKLAQEKETLAATLASKKRDFEQADDQLTRKKEKLTAVDAKLRELKTHLKEVQAELDANALELKKLSHDKDKLAREKKEAAATVMALVRQHEWIESEKQYFGQKDTAFEFREGDPNRDPSLCKKRLAQLQASQDKLSKNVNMKVMAMFDKAEKEYNDLIKKKQIVEQDKSKIEQAIEELDQKKNEALRKAYVQVNDRFGSIFSTLLPGTQAKLVPAEGGDVLSGLEVKVAFGQVWKESLTELSGGQRSLVALSLILSLLLFKPAPLYILDEVDAALDLSHTQNIGQMLRMHFKKSQFVVVSLKDGMFNNANVLFKTKFIDGVSTVRRFAQAPSATEKENSSGRKAANTSKKPKRAAKVPAALAAQRS
ncbi:SMC2 protein [Salpingoeca rosetta]|uniref:Structural maintenance of chromosomes protein n=1 Tax=Salpingoeca rosetta (strain ATCC 50818 / BSB-021) TaxID=946362 RepID=F2UFL3_SALR5|nr:SMC2 protein [Salpingoeca rosetta]EGD75581.1 SMC2 protein [Salpingoeca rosetta]|eukprot:XP_004992038.1 SMC2 protein [Salpingoeca rosetta]